jgi:hypothetical protein
MKEGGLPLNPTPHCLVQVAYDDGRVEIVPLTKVAPANPQLQVSPSGVDVIYSVALRNEMGTGA